jgi:arsenite transporter
LVGHFYKEKFNNGGSMKQLAWLQKNLTVVIPIVMVLGFLFGLNVESGFLKSAILPLTFLMVYPMMVNLQLKKVIEGGDTKVQAATQFLNFAITPFIAFGLGKLFFPDNNYLALGLLLTGLLPTSGMTISWTGMARGNMAAAVKMTVFGLLIGSVLTPLYIKGLMGATVEINMASIFKQIVVIVVIPLLLGNFTQRGLIAKFGMAHYQEKLKKRFPPFSTLGVVGIVFVAMALKANSIMANPQILITIAVPLVLLYTINLLIGILVGKLFFNRGDGIALLYGTVMRNLSIALAIAMTAFGKDGSDIALVIALGYIIQVQMAAWVVKLTDKIYGVAPEDDAEVVMHSGIFSLHTSQTIADALKMFADEHIHTLVVLDESDTPVGMFSQEMAISSVAESISLDKQLGDCELDTVITVGINQPINEIAKSMSRNNEYKVLVTNKNGDIQGVVTAQDILEDIVNPMKGSK